LKKKQQKDLSHMSLQEAKYFQAIDKVDKIEEKLEKAEK
jgi:hypothetical protein